MLARGQSIGGRLDRKAKSQAKGVADEHLVPLHCLSQRDDHLSYSMMLCQFVKTHHISAQEQSTSHRTLSFQRFLIACPLSLQQQEQDIS